MSPSCSTTCIKYILFLFNLLFVITGIIIISIGISVKNHYTNYDLFVDKHYMFAPALLIGTGILIFAISLFGCCGSISENACCTLTFSTLLLLIFFFEVGIGITGYFLKHTTTEHLADKLNRTMQYYREDVIITAAWDEIQRDFSCCGIHSPEDWYKVNSTDNRIPNSCCEPEIGQLGGSKCNINRPSLHKNGCLEAFGDFMKYHMQIIEAAGLSIAFVQFMGILLSCYLSSQIRKGYQTV